MNPSNSYTFHKNQAFTITLKDIKKVPSIKILGTFKLI
jgi:hypothetical protein